MIDACEEVLFSLGIRDNIIIRGFNLQLSNFLWKQLPETGRKMQHLHLETIHTGGERKLFDSLTRHRSVSRFVILL